MTRGGSARVTPSRLSGFRNVPGGTWGLPSTLQTWNLGVSSARLEEELGMKRFLTTDFPPRVFLSCDCREMTPGLVLIN